MSGPIFAAITLDPRGGGVAVASRLMWQVFSDEWGDRSHLATLLGDGAGAASLEAGAAARLRFGLGLARDQLLRRHPWVFCSHLAVARAQSRVPPPIRRPYAVFLHGIEVWRQLAGPQRRVLAGASLLVANSAHTARRVKAAHPWIGPIATCHLALGPAARRPSPSDVVPIAAGLGSQTVLVVARMVSTERYKGHDELLEAWPHVVSRVPGAQLVMAGEGDDRPRLQAKAGHLGISASVTFPGFVPESEIDALYGRAAVFAMPSRDEGFGIVYLEAMSHGLPCIGSTHDAAAELIEDGRTGFLVSQSDVQQLADRVTLLLRDDARRRAMGEAGRERQQREFSYEGFRTRLLACLLPTFERGRVRAGDFVHVPSRRL